MTKIPGSTPGPRKRIVQTLLFHGYRIFELECGHEVKQVGLGNYKYKHCKECIVEPTLPLDVQVCVAFDEWHRVSQDESTSFRERKVAWDTAMSKLKEWQLAK